MLLFKQLLKKGFSMKIFQVAVLAALLSTVTLTAGKNVAPVESPVAPVVSPSPFYIGVGVTMASIGREPCACLESKSLDDHRYGGILRVGMDFNQYIGVEARALKTFENDVFSETTHYGIYLKPQYHIMNQLNVYGLIGYGKTKVDYAGCDLSDIDVSGISYGIGFEYDLTDDAEAAGYDRGFDGQGDQETSWGIWADYVRVAKDEGVAKTTADIFSIGLTYDF